MDSEHRHQLQQNDLGQLAAQAVPWLTQYGAQALIGIAVALVVLIGGAVWWSTAESADEAAWSKIASAETVDEFGAVADKYPGTLPAAWAHLRSGELNLESGIAAMFRDRELALKDLASAKEEFEQVLKATVRLPGNLRERALLGLARVLEATCDGDTGPVVAAYEQILKDFPESIYKPEVDQKVAELKTGEASEFYRWFHAQKPTPAPFPRPQDGAGGTLPAGNPFELPPALKSPATTSPPSSTPPTTSTPEATSPQAATPAARTEDPAPAAAPESTTPPAPAAGTAP